MIFLESSLHRKLASRYNAQDADPIEYLERSPQKVP
jgi:hypothetical protein